MPSQIKCLDARAAATGYILAINSYICKQIQMADKLSTCCF